MALAGAFYDPVAAKMPAPPRSYAVPPRENVTYSHPRTASPKFPKNAPTLDEVLNKYREEDRKQRETLQLTEQEIEAQKRMIRQDLGRASHDYSQGAPEARTTKTLINSLETEVGQLVRESQQFPRRPEDFVPPKEPLASRGSRVIFASAVRADAAIKGTPANLVNYEDVEDMPATAKKVRSDS